MGYTRTAILMAAMTALFMGVGALLGGQSGAIVALVVAAAMNLLTWWGSDKAVLRMYGAQEVDLRTAPQLVAIVHDLADRAGMPRPRVFLIQSDQPNAFATGRSPSNAAVAATTGLLRALSPDEVAGVMAHELAHIRNHDTLIMTVTATFAGAISMLANFAMFFGGDRDRPGGFLGTLALMILAPLAAALVQMAISRGQRVRGRPDRRGNLRRAGMAGLGAGADRPDGAADRLQRGRAKPGHRAHVHHQPAACPFARQAVLDPPGDGEPGRGAAGHASCGSDERLAYSGVGTRRGRAVALN